MTKEEVQKIYRHSSLLADLTDVSRAADRIANEVSAKLEKSFPIVVAIMN